MRSLAAWLWMVEFEGNDRALDASETHGDLAEELNGHFGSVDVLRSSKLALESVQAHGERVGWLPKALTLGSATTAPWEPATFDCIVLHDALRTRSPTVAGTLAELILYRAMLKSNGWLAIGSPIPPLIGASDGTSGGMRPARLAGLLKQAGFRDVRCLFAEPSLEWPRSLVPDDSGAAYACEAFAGIRSRTFWARRAVARLGLLPMLYPAYFLLAQA